MKITGVTAFILCFIVLLTLTNAQAPVVPDPPTLPEDYFVNFKCPRTLRFVFECECYFNRIGRFEIPSFLEETCASRLAAVTSRPGLGVQIARDCERYYGHITEITSSELRAIEDIILDRCPRTLNKLCPGGDYEVLECTCFMVQTGILPTTNPSFIDECNATWGEVTPANKRIRRRRCRFNIKFKDFVGAFLGTVGRQCIQQGKKQCCPALPDP